jgi:hypothetical protein
MTASTPDPQGPLRRVPAAPGAEGGHVSPARHDLAPVKEPGSSGGARQDPAVSPAQPGSGGAARRDRTAPAARPGSDSAAGRDRVAAGSGWEDSTGGIRVRRRLR